MDPDPLFDRIMFVRVALADGKYEAAFAATTSMIANEKYCQYALAWLVHAEAALAVEDYGAVLAAWKASLRCNDYGLIATAASFSAVLARSHFAQGELRSALKHANLALRGRELGDSATAELEALRAQIIGRM